MAEAVLDASAVLAVINAEEGSQKLRPLLAEALLSAVNFAEIAARLADLGMPTERIAEAIGLLGVEVVPFTAAQALSSGALRPRTRDRGLSLGDRACLALAAERGLQAVTADRAWAGLDLGVEIEIIR